MTQCGAWTGLEDMRDITVGNSSTDHTATGTAQDRELLLLDGENIAHLRGQVAYPAERTGRLAPAEFGPLAATLQRGLAGRPVRAAVVAASPEQASGRFAGLLAMLDDGARAAMDLTGGVFLGEGSGLPSIGYLFPGQGSGKGDDGGALARRFETVCDLYRTVTLPACDDPRRPRRGKGRGGAPHSCARLPARNRASGDVRHLQDPIRSEEHTSELQS